MHEVLNGWRRGAEACDAAGVPCTAFDGRGDPWQPWIDGLSNVWVGVTIENRSAIGRAQLLRNSPAAVRFVSAEPLLGPLIAHRGRLWWHRGELVDRDDQAGLDLTAIDWLIAGGESGSGYRPVHSEWLVDLRDACQRTSTAFFFKQWGGRRSTSGGRELEGRTWDELPATVAAGAGQGSVR